MVLSFVDILVTAWLHHFFRTRLNLTSSACLKVFKVFIIVCFVADEEFDELCFEFGLELDEIVS